MKKCLYAVFAFFFFGVSVVHAERGGTALNGAVGNSSVQMGSPSDSRNSVVSGGNITVGSVETPLETTYFLSYMIHSSKGEECFIGNAVVGFPSTAISSGADLNAIRKSLLSEAPAKCKKGIVNFLSITRMPI